VTWRRLAICSKVFRTPWRQPSPRSRHRSEPWIDGCRTSSRGSRAVCRRTLRSLTIGSPVPKASRALIDHEWHVVRDGASAQPLLRRSACSISDSKDPPGLPSRRHPSLLRTCMFSHLLIGGCHRNRLHMCHPLVTGLLELGAGAGVGVGEGPPARGGGDARQLLATALYPLREVVLDRASTSASSGSSRCNRMLGALSRR
jgi:hypothetical protein